MTKWLLYCFVLAPADQQMPQTKFELFSSRDACTQTMRVVDRQGLDCMCMHRKSPVQLSPLEWEYEPEETDDTPRPLLFDGLLTD
jgi:hypothetical protein